MNGKKIMKVLIVIIVVLLIFIVGVKLTGKDNKEQNNLPQQNQQSQQQDQSNQPKEEFVEVQSNGSKVNKSEALNKTKKVDGLEISNIKLVESNNVSQLTASIKNPSNKVLGDFPISIKVLDKDGKEITTIGGYIDKVNPGETAELNASATVDFANAYDFEIIKK